MGAIRAHLIKEALVAYGFHEIHGPGSAHQRMQILAVLVARSQPARGLAPIRRANPNAGPACLIEPIEDERFPIARDRVIRKRQRKPSVPGMNLVMK
jgi:hypothetical protein